MNEANYMHEIFSCLVFDMSSDLKINTQEVDFLRELECEKKMYNKKVTYLVVRYRPQDSMETTGNLKISLSLYTIALL